MSSSTSATQPAATASASTSGSAATVADLPDMTQPDDYSDVILVVEERKLYACKAILGWSSPVWRRMFASDFKEKKESEIPLPGKEFDDIQELLLCVTPGVMKPITEDNVFRIVPLADEYQMLKLKQSCEKWLLGQVEDNELSRKQIISYLHLAQKYNVEQLSESCMDKLSDVRIADLESSAGYDDDLDWQTKALILKKRVIRLEKGDDVLDGMHKYWQEFDSSKCKNHNVLVSHCDECDREDREHSRSKQKMFEVVDDYFAGCSNGD